MHGSMSGERNRDASQSAHRSRASPRLYRDVNRTDGTTFLIVTHNTDIADRCDRTIEVVDGMIVGSAA
jgi:predicted ABC-type transport system involved in lysophospholipase L1 biosynthesis ATPase subunit